MAERFEAFRRFDYHLNSNLVIQKESHGPSQNEPTGEPESLAGRKLYSMGDKVMRTTPKELREITSKKKADALQKSRRDAKALNLAAAKRFKRDIKGGPGILEAEISDVKTYQPTTRETTIIYEQLLNEVTTLLGDQPEDVLLDAAGEVIRACRDSEMKDTQKKSLCDGILGSLNVDQFTKIYQMARSLHDYAEAETGVETLAGEARDGGIGDASGVAVIFDEEEEAELEAGDELVGDIRMEEEEEEEEEQELEAAGEIQLTAEEDEHAIALAADRFESDEEEPAKAGENMVLNVRTIDSHWLQRDLGKIFNNAEVAVEVEKNILECLTTPDLQECENKLVHLLHYDNFNFAKLLLRNRWRVYYCTRLRQAQGQDEKDQLMAEMAETPQGQEVLEELETVKLRVNKEREFARNVRREAAILAERSAAVKGDEMMEVEAPGPRLVAAEPPITGAEEEAVDVFDTGLKPSAQMNLEAMAFAEGGRLMANPVVKLRENSQRVERKEYDEVIIPAIKPAVPEDEKMDGTQTRIPIAELPEWARPAFTSAGVQRLNLIQSAVYPIAFGVPEKNMLICAPTGAGKTNIAVLSILALMGQYQDPVTGGIDKRAFKVVYISPMKALVAEQVAAFQKRFSSYGLRVEELTGDVNLTRQQIEDTQIIVATPEKWDVVTRKSGERAFTQLVKLVIFDEIHLLHDNRGPVIEALVARTLRQVEATQEPVRLVGLSATLPNYEDVAIFLRVSLKEGEGLFVFGSHYRPVPLMQTYVGLKEKKAVKRMTTMNRVTYEKVLENAGKNQVLVFVHSRKETVRTARMLRQAAIDDESLAKFLEEDSASREILQTEAEALKTQDLKDLLPFGFAVHHAGLPRTDRRLIEDLFADRHIQVLVSTATLAWGVNLPAHTVIIKGTQVYEPEKGKWCELSPLDVMQMMGRAGRPQYDTSGHGIIITNHPELQFYLSLNNQQLPIESQMLAALPDVLNAEVTLGTVSSRKDAVDWLGYTYLFVRLLRNPTLYGLPEDVRHGDPSLEQMRTDIAHSALVTLDKHQMIRYEKRTGTIQPTPLGRIASHYYIRCPSLAVYNEHLRPTFSDIELLRLFSLSHEFRYIPVREEEKVELSRLLERVPIPVKGTGTSGAVEETSTKVNVLLQAYISKLNLDGFALAADMTYIRQSAARIMRALFDMALRRGWAALARRALLFSKMVQARMWSMMSPLRQFEGALPEEVLRKLEKKDFPWERYFDLSAPEIGELIRLPKLGKMIHRLIHAIPKVDLSAYIQPLTRSTFLVEVSIIPDFRWDSKFHDPAGESFWLFVEDGDGDRILHHEMIVLKQHQVQQENYELTVDFAVPITEPIPPNYFLRCISDRWLQSEATLPISFKSLILPEKNPPPTELLDLQPLPVTALKLSEAEAFYVEELGLQFFGPAETQVFSALYQGDENIIVCAPPTSTGLRTCAELVILRMMKHDKVQRCVYVTPYAACAKNRYSEWKKFFEDRLNLKVAQLTGEIAVDLALIAAANIIIATPEHWDFVSRRWRTRRVLQQIRLFVVDELQVLDSRAGATMEVCISRMRYISAQLADPVRFIGLSAPLANAHEVASWLGVDPSSGLFNFPNVRPDLKIFVDSYDIYNRQARLLAMSRPTYQWIKRCCGTQRQALVFCPDRKQCRSAAVSLLLNAAAENQPKKFLHVSDEVIAGHIDAVSERTLQHTLAFGVGYLHEGFDDTMRELICQLFRSGAIQVLVVTEQMAWCLQHTAHLVIVQDTHKCDAKAKRWTNYHIIDIFRMMSLAAPHAAAAAAQQVQPAVFVLMCPQTRWSFYNKFKAEPLPLESCIDQGLADYLNAEVALKTIESKQDAVDWLTWSLYYRRLTKNPNFYGLQGVSPTHLSEHLSELIESAVESLGTAQCLEVDAEDETTLSPLNLGLIAAFYYVRYTTIDLLNRSLSATIKRKALIEVLCAASEFTDVVPIRFGEDEVLHSLAKEVGVRLGPTTDLNNPNVKALLLLYAHFHRASLTADLAWDQRGILEVCVRLLHAMVDVIGSNGWLAPALLAMEVCQMTVQALRPASSPLLQLPYFDDDRIQLAKGHGVNDIFDLINAEDEERDAVLKGLAQHQIEQVAAMCNRYPVVNVEFDVPGAISVKTVAKEDVKMDMEDDAAGTSEQPPVTKVYTVECGKPASVVVKLERVAESEDDIGPVAASYYPKKKDEQWWLVVGRPATNSLFAIKRTVANKINSSVSLDFDVPKEPGTYQLVLNLMCDSYVGCDQEYEFTIQAQEV